MSDYMESYRCAGQDVFGAITHNHQMNLMSSLTPADPYVWHDVGALIDRPRIPSASEAMTSAYMSDDPEQHRRAWAIAAATINPQTVSASLARAYALQKSSYPRLSPGTIIPIPAPKSDIWVYWIIALVPILAIAAGSVFALMSWSLTH